MTAASGSVAEAVGGAPDPPWLPEPSAAAVDRIAIDLAVAALAGREPASAIVVVVPSRVAVLEAIARLEGRITILAEASDRAGTAQIAAAADEAARLGPAGVRVVTTLADRSARGSGAFGVHGRALWIGPNPGTWRTTAVALDALLEGGSLLAIVGAGPLARLPAWLRPDPGVLWTASLDPSRIGNALGYTPEGRWPLAGLPAIGAAALRVAATRFGRPALADRLETRYRDAILAAGGPRSWSVGVWVGHKPRRD